MKNKYLDFYRINFGVGKYCAKSWGLASYEAGAASRQAEIDELKSVITKQQIQMLQIQQSCSGCDSRDLLIDELQKRLAVYERQGYKLVPINYECHWCGCTELDGFKDKP